MRRTRLAAAAGVAALTLGATVAVADDTTDTQTVTITVTAAPRSITVGEPAANLTVAVGAAASDSTTSPLAYNAGEDAAKIEVEVVADGNGLVGTELTLAVSAAGMSEDEGTATIANFNKSSNTAIPMDLVTGIVADEIVTDKTVTYTLGGTAPSTAGDRTVELKFTITDGPVPTP
jgi:hypothetical protein